MYIRLELSLLDPSPSHGEREKDLARETRSSKPQLQSDNIFVAWQSLLFSIVLAFPTARQHWLLGDYGLITYEPFVPQQIGTLKYTGMHRSIPLSLSLEMSVYYELYTY